MKSNKWLERQKKDRFVKEAYDKGYLSRAVFKLIEIDNKFNLIKKSKTILELGAAPGSWTQYICEKNKLAEIYAFDIKKLEYSNSRIFFYQKDILKFNFKSLNLKYDLILSDLAPNTIGHQSTDHLRIIEIIEQMIPIVNMFTVKNGNFVFKIWQGLGNEEIIKKLKKKFIKISYFKPKSSRKESSELYIIAQKFIL